MSENTMPCPHLRMALDQESKGAFYRCDMCGGEFKIQPSLIAEALRRASAPTGSEPQYGIPTGQPVDFTWKANDPHGVNVEWFVNFHGNIKWRGDNGIRQMQEGGDLGWIVLTAERVALFASLRAAASDAERPEAWGVADCTGLIRAVWMTEVEADEDRAAFMFSAVVVDKPYSVVPLYRRAAASGGSAAPTRCKTSTCSGRALPNDVFCKECRADVNDYEASQNVARPAPSPEPTGETNGNV